MAGWIALRREATPGGGGHLVAVRTPVLSVRRLPVAVSDLVADQRLQARLGEAVAPLFPTTPPAAQPGAVQPGTAAAGGTQGTQGAQGDQTQACIEVDVAGAPVFARDASTPLLPASNMKLLTADAALTRLGPQAVFTTRVATATPVVNGRLDGPLYLIGGGDPLLSTAGLRPSEHDWTESVEPVTSLETLSERVRAAGITSVTGPIVGDDSRYDSQRSLPSWKASYLSDGEIGPVGALVVNGGFVGVSRIPSVDPAAEAATLFARALAASGVTVSGGAQSGVAPAGVQQIAAIDSPPLQTIVGEMLRESDNLAAEMLIKELGYRYGGAGTWDAGVGVVRQVLAAQGVPLTGVVQVDGSGLDRSDRIPCDTLVAILDASTPAGAVIADSLPTAGDCGTLVARMLGTAAQDRVLAKTGSLTGVAALTGFVSPVAPAKPPACPPGGDADPRTDVGFAFLVNGTSSDAAGEALEDRIAVALASYPEMPVLDLFGPLQ